MYDWHGLPIDKSVWHSDGSAQGVDPLTNDRGVRFLGPQSRIVIPRKPPWSALGAIQVEMSVQIPSYPPSQQYLIAADESFGMYMEHAVLFGYCGKNSSMESLNTTANAVGQFIPIPTGRWVRLAFLHAGLGEMHLFVDGVLAATSSVTRRVPGVGSAGVCIGNAIDMGSYLHGEINELKIWRLDPEAGWQDFASRPIDQKVSNCWHDFLLRFNEILRAHPECERLLRAGVGAALERVWQSVVAHGAAARMQYEKFCEAHYELWRQGKIDGEEMRELAAEWIAWLRSIGIDPANDLELKSVLQSDCFRLMVETAANLDCDPKFMRMMGLYAAASGAPSRATAQ
jgi:hypothetical protein